MRLLRGHLNAAAVMLATAALSAVIAVGLFIIITWMAMVVMF